MRTMPPRLGPLAPDAAMRHIADIVAKFYGVPMEEFREAAFYRRPEHSYARAVAARYILDRFPGTPMRCIAAAVGYADRTGAHSALKYGARRIEIDPQLRKQLDRAAA